MTCWFVFMLDYTFVYLCLHLVVMIMIYHGSSGGDAQLWRVERIKIIEFKNFRLDDVFYSTTIKHYVNRVIYVICEIWISLVNCEFYFYMWIVVRSTKILGCYTKQQIM